MTWAERLHAKACEHCPQRGRTHYVAVKALVTILVVGAIAAPDHLHLPLAVGANLTWIWLEP